MLTGRVLHNAAASVSSWCFVPQRFVFPVLSISYSIKSQLYPAKSPDLQAERWGRTGVTQQHRPGGLPLLPYINLENLFVLFCFSVSTLLGQSRMEDCQQGAFGKNLIGRLTRRESFLCVFVCVRAREGGRGRGRGDFPAWGRGRGVSCLVEGSEMSFI